MAYDLIQEKFTDQNKSAIKTNLSAKDIQFSDHFSNDGETSDIISFSNLTGLDYNNFEREFIKLCTTMKERYKSNILYISMDEFVLTHEDLAQDITQLSINNMRGNLYANIYHICTVKLDQLKKIPDFIFIFACGDKWFAINTSEYSRKSLNAFKVNLKLICSERVKQIKRLTGVSNNDKKYRDDEKDIEEDLDSKKEELVEDIIKAAEEASDEDEAMDILDDNKRIAEILQDLEANDYGAPNVSKARSNRINKLKDAYTTTGSINGKSVKELIKSGEEKETQELPSSKMKVNSPNKEWENMKFINFNKEYDIDEDIALILGCFADKKYPIAVRNVTVEDTSTSLDSVLTYRAEMEDKNGKRFTLTFDMPKFKNNRFMMLRGTPKVIAGQLMNLPATKTNDSTVQLVTNYNKITVERYGSIGKSVTSSDVLIKALNKYNGKKIKISTGNNYIVASKYNLPIDYLDMAKFYNYIETSDSIYYFNQDKFYEQWKIDNKKGIPFVYNKKEKIINYYDANVATENITEFIAHGLCAADKEFEEIYNSTKPARVHMYSRAVIMKKEIPVIVVICNAISFNELLNRTKTKYRIETKRVRIDPNREGMIALDDAYFIYEMTPANSLLFNGLNACGIESYKINDLNKRRTWVEILDNFGDPRYLSDALDNFAELFVDPITKEVCHDCKIPDDYIGLLLYGNALLVDNAYIKHTNIYGNRYRTTEIVAGHLYKALAKSYEDYMKAVKTGRKNQAMTMKRTAVIDLIFANPVMSDLSIMTPLLEIENNYSATFKGLTGLNSDRAYGLDKRTYDKSMDNKLALSTGFSANVGINRQTTMDMDIKGKRGYIKPTDDNEEPDFTKKLAVTEALTPFGTTRDDPIRSAMNFTQTAKHSMPVDHSSPLLITNGADEAITYMVSDEFVWRAKQDGVISEIHPDYMIAKYKNGNSDYISLKDEVKKNSDGGFYITIRMKTDLKQGDRFKVNDILAYDEKSFSDKMGEADGLTYNVGVLAKVAILPTDEGFEDSTVMSEWLSKAMGTTVVTQIPVTLSANANVYDIRKIGDSVEEGDPLVIIQDSVNEKDIAALLHNIGDSDFVSDLGKVKIKSKYTGIVQDIKIYRTCEIDEMSSTLKKIVVDYEKGIKNKKAIYKKNNIEGANTLDPDYTMSPVGKLKNVRDGVMIEFYVKYFDTMGTGDKATFQSANKGVVKMLFPEGKEPYTAFRPEEKIHAMASSRSFNARMVTSPIVSGAINKGLIELDRQVKEIMGLKTKPIEEI